MNISTNDNMDNGENDVAAQTGGAFADGLTLIRVLMTPVIMAVIIIGWPSTQMAILASALFAIAALTDLFDDITGGAEKSRYRKLGWFDDIADTVLIIGTLAAMFWVMFQSGLTAWLFAVPAGIIILREVLVGLIKGNNFRKNGWPETRFGWLKTALYMLAIGLLVASPWLTSWLDNLRADETTVMSIYDSPSPYIWYAGQALLWLAAIFSTLTGFQLLTGKTGAANDG